ncbi:MAG: hypothetical protein RMM17_00120 [Acidobacteriota bacterium]|nr:hypothetical protein [Blastocatellia bacterium]MDW8411070.1 hypothetical protein [Acidobacteriota bacterium]
MMAVILLLFLISSCPLLAMQSARSGTTQHLQDDELPLIERAKRYIFSYLEDAPDFTVRQTIRRYELGPAGKWVQRDTIELEVTYESNRGEKYKIISLNGRPAVGATTLDSLGGASSTGEFVTAALAIFAPRSRALFRKGPRDQINGVATVIYDFKIKREHSANLITETRSGRSTVAGYSGSLWIDEDGHILRLEQAVDDVPADFPLNVAELAIDYDWVQIADKRYLLPKRAEVIIGSDKDRHYSRNVVHFDSYRKFSSDIKIDIE